MKKRSGTRSASILMWMLALSPALALNSPRLFAQPQAGSGDSANEIGRAANVDLTAAAAPVSVSDSPCVLRGQPIELFDGKTLEGWSRRDGSPSKNWGVDEGTLFRATRGGDLYHRHWFRDFDFSFEWKIEDKGNSGVKYRVQAYGSQMLGCEYQVQDDNGHAFNRHATGGLYAVVEPGKNKSQRPSGEWNRSRIVVCGNQVEHWLNGERVVATEIGSPDWLKRVESSKFRDKPFFGQNREGRIFLQDHGNPVWFRNMVLTPLDADAS